MYLTHTGIRRVANCLRTAILSARTGARTLWRRRRRRRRAKLFAWRRERNSPIVASSSLSLSEKWTVGSAPVLCVFYSPRAMRMFCYNLRERARTRGNCREYIYLCIMSTRQACHVAAAQHVRCTHMCVFVTHTCYARPTHSGCSPRISVLLCSPSLSLSRCTNKSVNTHRAIPTCEHIYIHKHLTSGTWALGQPYIIDTATGAQWIHIFIVHHGERLNLHILDNNTTQKKRSLFVRCL